MAQVVRLPLPDRPAPPMAQVLDLKAERSRLKREARQRIAMDRALRTVKAAFPDVDFCAEPGAFSALISLAVEQLIHNPDFEGELG